MIPKSIKWRLQLWYGLILVAVLAGFGVTAYQLQKGRTMGRIDQELHRRFNILVDALHPRPRRPGMLGRMSSENPPPDRPFYGPPTGPGLRPRGRFELPAWAVGLFDTNAPNGYYFVITAPDNKLIARMGNEPVRTILSSTEPTLRQNVSYPKKLRPAPTRMVENCREIFNRAPTGEFIVVGRSILPELKELHRTAMNLTAVGGMILLIGLTGGWWLVNRALRPVSEISSAAAKISAGDLSQRINAAETGSELGQLAAVLNSTFARLEAAFAQQKQFASDAAHELRTPVAVMLTQTQAALNRERDAASYKQTVEACQRAAQRMRRLIESLLELARFDAGQEILNRLPFDLSQTVADSVDMVRPLADEFQVKTILDLSPAEIVGDAGRLGQVITNLLSNAIQYNQSGGEVRVGLEMQGGLAVLTVSDSGQGIAPEDLPHVFERFYRADVSRTGRGNTGLGLSICKAIVEAHGGTIEIASEIGKGSVFTVRLPA